MSRWLLHSKILSRNDRNLFLGLFVTHLEYLKDFRFVLPLGFQGIDIGFDGRGGLCEGSRGRGLSFGGANGLGAQVSSGWSTSGVITLVGTMTLLPAAEAKSFFDAPHSLCRGKLREGNGINVHGVVVVSSSGGMDGGRESSSLQRKDSHLLGVEYLGLFNPFHNSGRYRRHREDHSHELLVES